MNKRSIGLSDGSFIDQVKVSLFLILSVLYSFFLLGIIPFFFVINGFVMLRRKADFIYIQKSRIHVRNSCIVVASIFFFMGSAFIGESYIKHRSSLYDQARLDVQVEKKEKEMRILESEKETLLLEFEKEHNFMSYESAMEALEEALKSAIGLPGNIDKYKILYANQEGESCLETRTAYGEFRQFSKLYPDCYTVDQIKVEIIPAIRRAIENLKNSSYSKSIQSLRTANDALESYRNTYNYIWELPTSDEYLLLLLCVFSPAIFYILFHYLYWLPMDKNRGGVLTAAKERLLLRQHQSPKEVDIIKSENLKQYSVAEELLAWSKLKDSGVITESEFSKAKSKLLNG